jgi:pyrimidine-specific ribonucleoside hydrolase
MRKLTLFIVILNVARWADASTVWIDTDVSIGSPIREVDDAYAIILALHSPEIQIAGISTSYGNAPLGQTTRAARELIRQFGAEANVNPDQIFAGARSSTDFGRRSEASEALLRVLENNSVTYIALGPLTNLATFLQLHPERARKINRVIFVGGQAAGTTLAFGRNGSFHIHDANVFKDPRAAAFVLQTKIPLTLVPIATGSLLALNQHDLGELEQQGGAGRYLARRSKVWLWFWRRLVGTDGAPVFDAGAIVAATRPKLVSSETRYGKMDRAGNLIVTRRPSAATTATQGLTSGARPLRYCTSFAPGTKRFVMRRLVTRRSSD